MESVNGQVQRLTAEMDEEPMKVKFVSGDKRDLCRSGFYVVNRIEEIRTGKNCSVKD